jgi:hypothetical protein
LCGIQTGRSQTLQRFSGAEPGIEQYGRVA